MDLDFLNIIVKIMMVACVFAGIYMSIKRFDREISIAIFSIVIHFIFVYMTFF